MTETQDEERFAAVRPQHRDFKALAASISGLDEMVDSVGPGFDFDGLTRAYVDPDSMAYIAIQRSMRAFGVTNASELEEMSEYVQRGAALYTEAFLLGAGFQQDKDANVLPNSEDDENDD